MIDVNTSLRIAYASALSGLSYNSTAVQTFYQNAPDSIADKYYVIINPFLGIGDSDKGFNQTQTSMQVTVCTWNEKYNDGLGCDNIAGQVLQAILPTPQAKLVLTAGINTQINLVSDNMISFKAQNQRNYINRTIIFRHQILHN